MSNNNYNKKTIPLIESEVVDFDSLVDRFSDIIWNEVKNYKKIQNEIKKFKNQREFESNFSKYEEWRLSNKDVRDLERKISQEEYIAQRLYWHIHDSVRKFTERPPQFVSTNVADIFIYLLPEENPFDTYFSRHRKKLENQLGVFMTFEHTTPVNEIVRDFLKSDSIEDIRNLLYNYSGAAWITRKEEECLRQKGFGKSRPKGWRRAYNECEISVLSKNRFKQYKNKLTQIPKEEFLANKQFFKKFFSQYKKNSHLSFYN